MYLEPLGKQATIVMGLTVVGLMAFGLTLSFYRNVLFEQQLANIGEKNEQMRQKIEHGQRMLKYYQSNQYKDKYAKENLSKINPGEKVLILHQLQRPDVLHDREELLLSEQQEAAYLELLRHMPVIEHWKLFLFHRDRVEELKRSFYQT